MFGYKHYNVIPTNYVRYVIVIYVVITSSTYIPNVDCRPNASSSDAIPSPLKTTKDGSTNGNIVVDTQTNIKPTIPGPDEHNGHTNVGPKTKSHDHEKMGWLVYVSAVPTVLVFIICVVIIAIKNRYNNAGVPETMDGAPKKTRKKTSKQKLNQEVYDTMLAKFKDEKNRKRSFVGRKSSQIRIEGMVSRSPKSLARKHIIIGQLAEEDLAPDGNSSALGQLVQLSTHTFIGSSLIEDIETPTWQTEATEQARKDFSARMLLEYDENDALLPEDLEDVFSNFGNWEESLI